MGVNVTQMGGGGKKIAESTATTVTDVPASKAISAKGITKGSYDEQSKILLPYAKVANAIGIDTLPSDVKSGKVFFNNDGRQVGSYEQKINKDILSLLYPDVTINEYTYLPSSIKDTKTDLSYKNVLYNFNDKVIELNNTVSISFDFENPIDGYLYAFLYNGVYHILPFKTTIGNILLVKDGSRYPLLHSNNRTMYLCKNSLDLPITLFYGGV